MSEAARTVNGPPREPAGHGVRSPAAGGSLGYRLPMQVRRFDDITAFREVATPYLVRDEARHNLILGISSTLMQKPDLHPVFDLWVASDGDEVTGAALRTPPFNLVLAQPANDPALDALVDRMIAEGQDLPGVVAAIPEDREQVIAWALAFADEVLPEETDRERHVRLIDARLRATGDAGLWLWEDGGGPVSLSGYGGSTPNGIRIGPVYTPPEHRGRGYATSLVTQQSHWLLGARRSFCFLYTDLDNPTSNALYRRIGYRMVAEAREVRFDVRGAA